MANTKKKKKLKIKATGVGDPTVLLTIQLTTEDIDPIVSSIPIQVEMELSKESATVLALQYTTSFSTGRDIKILSSFFAENEPENSIDANIVFNSSEYDFIIENDITTLTASKPSEYNTIDYQNIPIIYPSGNPLKDQAIIAFQSLEQGGQAVFIKNHEGTALAESIMDTDNPSFMWRANEISPNNFTLQSLDESQPLYLVAASEGQVELLQELPNDNSGVWNFEKMEQTWNKYQVKSILEESLFVNTNLGSVGLQVAPSYHYLHVL